MGERILRMRARDVENLLRKYGFSLISQRGSHRKWRRDRIQVIIPEHRGRDLPMGTLRDILIEAQIPENEWRI
ncbi:MAG TPA: type II toxin-antitoxin system HicA family toxin [Candidatus Hydrogenedentes bacterium]|nr:type II toxin-antitoxin system HicA family toxin [Candidatus Hydrogenedentota bacterium]